ncbi:MAG: imidazole glycerol phosphate synthase subunit HisH [Candidatus Omnitrophota bacterium]
MSVTTSQVCIVDYGSGNIRSVFNIFKSFHGDVKILSGPADLEGATHIVLPGVGAFGAAMAKINALSVFPELCRQVLEKKKWYLGICVGMQILADEGFEYGHNPGLGWIGGSVKKLDAPGLRLPHVGWNNFENLNEACPIFKGITTQMDFYYVHSYAFEARDPKHAAASCVYGTKFTPAVWRENIFGVQFHPEKSQKAGIRLLENFLGL